MNERLIKTVVGLRNAGVELFQEEKKIRSRRVGSMMCEVNRVSHK
jgi:hypothetical protein